MSLTELSVISKQTAVDPVTAVEIVTSNVYGNPADPNIIEIDIVRRSGASEYPWQWVERKRDGLLDGYSTTRYATAGDAAIAAQRMAEADGAPVTDQVQTVMRKQQLAGWELRFFGHAETACVNELQFGGYHQRIQEEVAEAIIEEKDAKPGLDATEWPPEDEDFDPYRDALWDTYPRGI